MRYPLTLFFGVLMLVTSPLLLLATGFYIALAGLTVGFYVLEKFRPRP